MSKNTNSTPQLVVTDTRFFPIRDSGASRLKSYVTITFNNVFKVSGFRVVEGARGLFLSSPSEMKSERLIPLFVVLERELHDSIQNAVLARYTETAIG